MSTVPRKRTTCQACGDRCQSTPIEWMTSQVVNGQRSWLWHVQYLCPPCRAARSDFLEVGEGELVDE